MHFPEQRCLQGPVTSLVTAATVGEAPGVVNRTLLQKDCVVAVGARAAKWLERYLKEVRPRLCLDTRTPALFLTGYGEALNPDVPSRMVAGWMKAAGLKGSRHLLRHTCTTHMLEGGADIRYIEQLLGHEKL